MMLGQLLERTEATQSDVKETRADVHQIKARLAHGDAQFAELRRRMDTGKTEIGKWERVILESVRVGQFLLVLWLTGSLDAAVRVLIGGAR
jgi:hypothetical protein